VYQTANFVEAAVIVDASRDPVASRRFDDLIKEAQIIIEPVTEPQAQIAREAYRDFGKGSSHPAKAEFRRLLCLREANVMSLTLTPIIHCATDGAGRLLSAAEAVLTHALNADGAPPTPA
jgi:uncharacterized protein with PIN domain